MASREEDPGVTRLAERRSLWRWTGAAALFSTWFCLLLSGIALYGWVHVLLGASLLLAFWRSRTLDLE